MWTEAALEAEATKVGKESAACVNRVAWQHIRAGRVWTEAVLEAEAAKVGKESAACVNRVAWQHIRAGKGLTGT